jgi:hypothetical protein
MSSLSGLSTFNQIAAMDAATRPIDPETGKPMKYAKMKEQEKARLADQRAYWQASQLLGRDIGMNVFQQAKQAISNSPTPTQINNWTGMNSQQQVLAIQNQLYQNLNNGNRDPYVITNLVLRSAQASESYSRAISAFSAFTKQYISDMMNRKEESVKVSPPVSPLFVEYNDV